MDAARLVADAAWIPHRYDIFNDILLLAYLPRERQRLMTFLDPRFVRPEWRSPPMPVGRLQRAAGLPAAAPLHFVFHTAFCGSTLLARALDAPGISMGLKEPSVLGDFAKAWLHRRQTPAAESALELTLRLLSRPFSPGEAVIVKPSNAANHFAHVLLERLPGARAVILHSSLSEYLHATIRGGDAARAFGRTMLRDWMEITDLTSSDRMSMTDLQAGALGWLMQAHYFNGLINRVGPKRVRTLSKQRFLAQKAETLVRVSQHFELGGDAAVWAKVAEGPIFGEHAKRLGERFDPSREIVKDQAKHDEVEAVSDWAGLIAARNGWRTGLGDTLFA